MDFNKHQPIYIQISEYIYENILLGKWKEKERISSVRELSMNLLVNPNTVMRAYTYLQKEGILFNQRGIGYFIAENATSKIKDLKKTHFIDVDLPDVFKTGKLLGISTDELREYYINYLRSNQ